MIRRDGPIVQKSLTFSIAIIKYCDSLAEKKKFIISNQLMKSGTSIAGTFELTGRSGHGDFSDSFDISRVQPDEGTEYS